MHRPHAGFTAQRVDAVGPGQSQALRQLLWLARELARAFADFDLIALLRAVVASDAYKKEYAKESLIPVVMGRAEARAFTQKAATEITQTLRELGVVR